MIRRMRSIGLLVCLASLFSGCSDRDSQGLTEPVAIGSTLPKIACHNTVTFLSATSPIPAGSDGWVASFRVTNISGLTTTTAVTCSGSLQIHCLGVTPASVTLANGASATVNASYEGLSHGFGFVSVTSCGASATSTKIFVN
jgi:hypothetical protein